MKLSLNLTGGSLELPDAVDELGRQHATGMLGANELHYIAAALCAYPWSEAPDSIVVETAPSRGARRCSWRRCFGCCGLEPGS